MLRFKIIGGVALLLLASSCLPFSSTAFAGGRGVLRCDSCMTVNDFSVTAENYVEANVNPPESGLNRYRFVILNLTDKLLGEVIVGRFYDYETHTLTTHVTALTGTIADMEQTYRVAFPDFGITAIPTGVASTFTGSDQQSVVGPYLADYFADSNPVQGMTTLALFADYTSAVYQLTDAATADWTMVPMSGHDSSGNPLDDNAQPVTMAPPEGTIITPNNPPVILPSTEGGGYYLDVLSMFGVVILNCFIDECTTE